MARKSWRPWAKKLFGEKAAKSEGDQTTCCERELRRLMERSLFWTERYSTDTGYYKGCWCGGKLFATNSIGIQGWERLVGVPKKVKGGIWRSCGRFFKKGKWLKQWMVAEGRNGGWRGNSRGMEKGNRGMEGRWSFPTDWVNAAAVAGRLWCCAGGDRVGGISLSKNWNLSCCYIVSLLCISHLNPCSPILIPLK